MTYQPGAYKMVEAAPGLWNLGEFLIVAHIKNNMYLVESEHTKDWEEKTIEITHLDNIVPINTEEYKARNI